MASGSPIIDYFDAKNAKSTIQIWYDMVKTPLDKSASKKLLEEEAKNMKGKPGSRMAEYLARATDSKKSVPSLTREENLVVLMYTDDNDAKAFFNEYNLASRKASKKEDWEPYKIYTTLLTSALRKLAEKNPLPKNTPLYRGIGRNLSPPTTGRIFWKSFTSTTLDLDIAEEFAGDDGIILEFQPPASRYAAHVGVLSPYDDEGEAILLPFEAFDFLGVDGQQFRFKTSKTQELLK